jgi:hypothetical protein
MQGQEGRRVRPRPMNYNERFPVVRTHGPGSDRLDPKLVAFLAAQEEELELLRIMDNDSRKKASQVRRPVWKAFGPARRYVCLHGRTELLVGRMGSGVA